MSSGLERLLIANTELLVPFKLSVADLMTLGRLRKACVGEYRALIAQFCDIPLAYYGLTSAAKSLFIAYYHNLTPLLIAKIHRMEPYSDLTRKSPTYEMYLRNGTTADELELRKKKTPAKVWDAVYYIPESLFLTAGTVVSSTRPSDPSPVVVVMLGISGNKQMATVSYFSG